MQHLNTVLFDLDGVLVSSEEIHRTTLNSALLDIANIEIPREEYLEHFLHLYTTQKIQKLVDQQRLALEDADDVYALKQARTSVALKRDLHTHLNPLALVEYLQQQGWNVACVTGAVRKSAYIMLHHSKIISYMDLIVTRDDTERTKPDPEPYLKAMSLLKVAPYQCIIVEDEEKGIVSAKRSGCPHIWEIEGIHNTSIDGFKQFVQEIA